MERVTNNQSDLNVKDAFVLLENNCATNVEYSQIRNELIFKILHLKPSIFIELLEYHKFKDIAILNFLHEVENPIHDDIDLSSIMFEINSMQQNKTTEKILSALTIAKDKQLK